MFRMTNQELEALMSQIATSKPGRGGTRKAPMVFTEHGAIMAAAVLNSPRAMEVSVYVVRAFVQMREALVEHKEVSRRLDDLERKVGSHDRAIAQIFNALRQLTAPPEPPKSRRIGFL
jgi:phage regulator Rha-like protein